MKQFQLEYESLSSFQSELKKVEMWTASKVVSDVLFTIYTSKIDKEKIEEVCNTIHNVFPKAHYMGCSTNGNIIRGEFCNTDIGVTCTIFEYPSTQLRILQYTLTENTVDDVTKSLLWQIERNPWVRAVQLLTTIRGMSMTRFCENLRPAAPGVRIFGGGAFSEDMSDNACVFSEEEGYSENGVVFALIGGEDFRVNTTYISGWKPLGKELEVTKAKGSTLYELDGKPAYDVYYKYLHIKNDENFFNNTLEFPFFYHHNGIDILRAPVSSNPDGSLTMTSDIEEKVMARIAYGDPWTILEIVRKVSKDVREFCPEAITIFSCAARRTFWGTEAIGKETMPFQNIAPTSGFYTSGEFLRTSGHVNQHNVTLVVASMREGEPSEEEKQYIDTVDDTLSARVSMINRLATFIEAATEELEEANRKLEEVAITDGLTKVYNRREIQRRIIDATKQYAVGGANTLNTKMSLIMIDIDNFKKVNDNYGHKVGDNVLIGLSDVMRDIISNYAPGASPGRWGGEEFMILLPGYSIQRAQKVAEKLRAGFGEVDFDVAGRQTISVGVTEALEKEDADSLCIRVDEALYTAKENGKNQVVVK